MSKFLLDNSIILTFLVTMLALGINFIRHEMKLYDLSLVEYTSAMKFQIMVQARKIYFKMVGITILTVLSSMIIFGNFWTPDAFKTILLCVLVQSKVKSFVKYLLG